MMSISDDKQADFIDAFKVVSDWTDGVLLMSILLSYFGVTS